MSAIGRSSGRVPIRDLDDISTPEYRVELTGRIRASSSLLPELSRVVFDYARHDLTRRLAPTRPLTFSVRPNYGRFVLDPSGGPRAIGASLGLGPGVDPGDIRAFDAAVFGSLEGLGGLKLMCSRIQRVDDRRVVGLTFKDAGCRQCEHHVVVADYQDSSLIMRKALPEVADTTMGALSPYKAHYYVVSRGNIISFSMENFEFKIETRFNEYGRPIFIHFCEDATTLVVAKRCNGEQYPNDKIYAFMLKEDGSLLQISEMDCAISVKSGGMDRYTCAAPLPPTPASKKPVVPKRLPPLPQPPAPQGAVVVDFLNEVKGWLALPKVQEKPDLVRRLEAKRVELDSIFPNTDLELDQIDARAALKAEVEALNNPKEGQ